MQLSFNENRMLCVFNFRYTLLDEYRTFYRCIARMESAELRDEAERHYEEGRYWLEPLIQIDPDFQRNGTVH